MEQQSIADIRSELVELGFELNQINQALALTTDKEKLVELLFQFQEDEQNSKASTTTTQPVQTDLSKVSLLTDHQLLGIINPALNLATKPVKATKKDAKEVEDDDEDFEDEDEEEMIYYKMVFLVRMDLKMGAGKVAAQTGHAVLGAYKQLEERSEEEEVDRILDGYEECGTPKIVLKVESKEQLIDLERKAREAGINTYVVCDAGRTQVEPGSMTVCAIGPDRGDKIDLVTKHLRLLN